MQKFRFSNRRRQESGNVLFLILIAVALFAALSYAVTQSSRSGSGDASSETNLVNSASLTEYPAGVRTSVVRMIIAGTGVDQLQFNSPSDFGAAGFDTHFGVFHPDGGGAVYGLAPADLMRPKVQTAWIFTGDYQIANIGTTDLAYAGTASNDLVAFLVDVSSAVCKKINSQLGIAGTDGDGDGIPGAGATIAIPTDANDMVAGKSPVFATVDAAHTVAGAFSGQPFGCFDDDDGSSTNDDTHPYIYYHVMVER